MAKKFETEKKNAKKSGFAKRLYDLRKSRDWSQKQIAEEFYVSPGTIALWELGQREIPGPVRKLIELYELKK